MDISSPSFNPDDNTQRPLSTTFHGQATANCRVKTAESVRFMPEDSEPQGAEQKNPKALSPRDRTVIEFSKFCASHFYPKTDCRRTGLPNEFCNNYSHIAVFDFCTMMRLFSHSHKSLFNDITDTIRVTTDDEDEAKDILRKLVYSEEYDCIKGIEAARKVLPGKVKVAHHPESSETGFFRSRRLVRIVPRKFREDPISAKPSPDRRNDKLRTEEKNSLPIKRRKTACSKKPDNNPDNNQCKIKRKRKRQKERLDAVKDTITACLKNPTTKKDIENTMKLIFHRSDHWQDFTSLRTSMKRWFSGLNSDMTKGFTEEEIKQAEEVFSRLIGSFQSPPEKKRRKDK